MVFLNVLKILLKGLNIINQDYCLILHIGLTLKTQPHLKVKQFLQIKTKIQSKYQQVQKSKDTQKFEN